MSISSHAGGADSTILGLLYLNVVLFMLSTICGKSITNRRRSESFRANIGIPATQNWLNVNLSSV